jgi:hypothetical protein
MNTPQPIYYVKHPDGTFSVASRQPINPEAYAKVCECLARARNWMFGLGAAQDELGTQIDTVMKENQP